MSPPEDKSILDQVADVANDAIAHALEMVKAGSTNRAHDALDLAERLSRHAREIEDHDMVMEDRHRLNVSVPTDQDIAGVPLRAIS